LTSTQVDASTSGKAAAGRDVQECKAVPVRSLEMVVVE
jgi:hypothetical protein